MKDLYSFDKSAITEQGSRFGGPDRGLALPLVGVRVLEGEWATDDQRYSGRANCPASTRMIGRFGRMRRLFRPPGPL